MKTTLGLASIVFAVWLAWAISHDYGKRAWEKQVPVYGDQKR
jgi:hypothetical protein